MKVAIDLELESAAVLRIQSTPGVEAVFVPQPGTTESGIKEGEGLEEVEALLCTFAPGDPRIMRRLKLIQIASVGYTQLVSKGLVERGIRACNAQGVFDVPIAEWNIAMIWQLARNMRELFTNQERRIWNRSPRYQTEVRGSVLGLWGYGGIGRETARLAKALGMRVRVLTRGPIKVRKQVYCIPGTGDPAGTLPDEAYGAGEVMRFLDGLDFLVLAMPLTDSNRGILGRAELRRLPSSAYVLNPSRGPLIDEESLLCALREGWISGAALDTHYHYPLPPDHPLWAMPNVILTPHISGSTGSPFFSQRIVEIFTTNLQRYQRGEPLLNELSADQLNGL